MTQNGKRSKASEEKELVEPNSLRSGKSKAVGSLCKNLPGTAKITDAVL